MNIFKSISELPENLQNGVVVLGNFDGLHKGHVHVLNKAKEIADKKAAPLHMVTFSPHPRRFFNPEKEPFRLTSDTDKAEIIEKIGFSSLIIQKFDGIFAKKTPEEFVKDFLCDVLAIKHVVVGWNYVFGNKKSGDIEKLIALSDKYGFEVTSISPFLKENISPVSSTMIRNFIRNGEFEQTSQYLGRYWQITEKVINGQAKGRKIKYPTANIDMGEYLRPKKGVMAVLAKPEGKEKWLRAIANYGTRPTVSDNLKDGLLEVHILDYSADLYQKSLQIKFIEFLREEKKFENMQKLKKQIDIDVINAKRVFDSIRTDF